MGDKMSVRNVDVLHRADSIRTAAAFILQRTRRSNKQT